IVKSIPDLPNRIVEDIHQLQKLYFLQLSDSLLNRFSTEKDELLCCLSDPAFIHYFNTLCQEKKIVEYYILDKNGSFILLDAKGNVSWLIVADEEMMNGYYQLANSNYVPNSIKQDLKNKKRILFCYSEQDYQTHPSKWEPLLHPAKVLKGQKNYYYA